MAWRLGLLGAALAVLFGVGVCVSPGSIVEWGPVAFVALGALLVCALFPGQVTAAAAGAVFGVVAGVGLALAAAVLGALGAFVLARRLGGADVEQLLGAKGRRWRGWIGEHGFSAVLMCRLLPGAPVGVLNYVAGLTPMRVRAFAAAVALGALPKTVAYVALGGALHDPLSARGLVALVLYAATTGAGVLLARRNAQSQGIGTSRTSSSAVRSAT